MNLRKDHCRNLPSRKTREHVHLDVRGGVPRPPAPSREQPPAQQRNPGANRAKEHELMACPPAPGPPARGGGTCPYLET